jgi:putative transposase
MSLNRSSYYYRPKEKALPDAELIKELNALYGDAPFFGYRRVKEELNDKGFELGRRRVLKLKALLGLHTLYPKKKTTIANKQHKKYPYLLKGVKITKPNQVWSIDITYISVGRSTAYLVGIIDWFSRKIISYRISNSMDKSFCIEALNEAMEKYGKPEIFNSDQGSQFTSEDFTSILKDNDIKISMDGKGRWADNILIERFFRSMKYEEVYLKHYDNLKEAKLDIAKYINFYNTRRKHSSLAYNTPDNVYFKGADFNPKFQISKEIQNPGLLFREYFISQQIA